MDIARKLRFEGLKVTSQRLAVFRALQGRKDHPSAEKLYNELRVEYPSLSLATLYKTLEMFKRIGLVQSIDVGENRVRFDPDTHHHFHIRCIKCHRVDDMEDIDTSSVIEQVEKQSGYHVSGAKFVFEGVCPKCRKEMSH